MAYVDAANSGNSSWIMRIYYNTNFNASTGKSTIEFTDFYVHKSKVSQDSTSDNDVHMWITGGGSNLDIGYPYLRVPASGDWSSAISINKSYTSLNPSTTYTIVMHWDDVTSASSQNWDATYTFSITTAAKYTYTITYDGNYNDGGTVPGTQTKTWGTDINISSNLLTRTGFDFLGWSTSNTATTATYAPGAVYSTNSGATLYAVFKPIEVPTPTITSQGTTSDKITIKSTTAGVLHYVKNLPSTVYYSNLPVMVWTDNSVWVRIYSHDSRAGTILWTSSSEALNTQTTYKYSRLNLLTSSSATFKDSNGKYEFMLRCPTRLQGWNRWKQTNAPQSEYVTPTSTGDGTAAGYEAVSINWTGSYWGGMTRQNSSATDITTCYLSGSVGHTNWWYALAPNQAYQAGVPCPNSVERRISELWVRIPGLTGTTINISANQNLTLTNLSEQSNYYLCVRATNNGGPGYSSTLKITTSERQAKIKIKTNNGWTTGKVWIKTNASTWTKAKHVYVKSASTTWSDTIEYD